MNNRVSIPMIAPDFKMLRADAVWVTIANWAEGFESKYGSAQVFAGANSYTPEQIRAKCFSQQNAMTQLSQSAWRKTYLAKLAETLLKDTRWYLENKNQINFQLDRSKHIPFVWQHHDLFQTRGLELAKSLNVPSVLFVDAPYVWESKKWGNSRIGWEWFSKQWGDTLPMKKADLVLVVSEEVKQAVLELGVDNRKILITPCTVSSDKFNVDLDIEKKISLGLMNQFVIGWIGSFRKFHSLDLLIDAFFKVSIDIPNAKLLLVGDGPERIRLQEKIESLGLKEQVIFTGSVPHNEVPNYLKCFDLAVLPSQSNLEFHYSPLKLREFFAAGIPVIASALGDVKKVIEESRGGWLVPPDNSDLIAEKIKNVANDQANREIASAHALMYAKAEMGIGKQIRMIEEYFGI